jgi:uncharacterized protein YndB with AHSA1/START domain
MYYWRVMYWKVGMQQVIRSIEIQVPPSNVWRWFATQEGLRRWISSNIEIDLRVGGAYRFLGPDDQTTVQDYERGADQHRILYRLADLVNAGDADQY